MAKKSRNDYYPDYSVLNEENGDILKKAVKGLSKVLGNATEKYKDTVFRMLLNDKRVALEVYNAMNGSAYDDPDEVIITTLENAVYMGVRNDASFIIASQLMVYEHQSTVNPNMPLRSLEYVTCLMAAFTYNANIYGRQLIRLPEPKFVVFYNGSETVPDRYEMRLSAAYERQTDEPSLELKVDVVNINPGCNDELLAKSPTLYQYMEFVEKIRKYSEEYPFEEAVTHSVDECIKEGILAEFLEKNRAEVLRTSIFVYDQEKHMRQTYEEGVQDGEERGIQIGEKRGEQTLLTKLVGSKVKKGYTLEQTAEALEYPIKELEPIYNMVKEAESPYNASSNEKKDK